MQLWHATQRSAIWEQLSYEVWLFQLAMCDKQEHGSRTEYSTNAIQFTDERYFIKHKTQGELLYLLRSRSTKATGMRVNRGIRRRSTNKSRPSTKHLQTNNKGSSWTYLTTYCTYQKESWVAKNYDKGPATLHFTAHNNKQINNCEWITRKAWEIQAILKLTHTHTHTMYVIQYY